MSACIYFHSFVKNIVHHAVVACSSMISVHHTDVQAVETLLIV